MRKIELSTAFKKDLKALRHTGVKPLVDSVITLLQNDEPLPERYRDHNLSGDLAGYRECHIKPDLLLIYLKEPDVLKLARLGSHSKLFK
jgi:mRNA interferase YafQ